MSPVGPHVWLLSCSITRVGAGVSPPRLSWPSNAPLNGYTPPASPFIILWTRGLLPPRGYRESAARTAAHAFLRGRVFSLLWGGYQEWNCETYGGSFIIRGTARRLSKAAPLAFLPVPAIFIGKVPFNGEWGGGTGDGGRGTESGCRDQRPDCCPRGREAATLLAHPAQVRRPQRPQGARSACARNSGRQSHHRSCLLFRLPWMGSVLQITTAIIFMIRKIRSGEKRKETESPMVQGTCRSKPAASGLRCPLFVLHLRTHRRKWGARTSVQARSPALLGRGQEATST